MRCESGCERACENNEGLILMTQSKKGDVPVSSTQLEGDAQSEGADVKNERYNELLHCLLHEKKNTAIQKHPELASAYKAMEVYEVYFLAGGDWDKVGAIEFKKKMAEKIVNELIAKE